MAKLVIKDLKSFNDEFVKSFPNKRACEDESWKYLKNKYFYNNMKNNDKTLRGYNLKENEAINEFMWHFGKIYTFQYKRPKNMNDSEKLPYYDIQPIVLPIRCGWVAKSSGNIILTGVNLNFIPPKMRFMILDQMFSKLKSRYQASIRDMRQRENHRVWEQSMADEWAEFLYYICNKLVKTGFQFSIRSYIVKTFEDKVDEVNQIYRIPLSDWKYILNVNLQDVVSTRGYNYDNIYQLFWMKFKDLVADDMKPLKRK